MTQAKVADSGVVQPTFHGVLRHREFRGLWLAQITSSIGDQLAKIAIAILVYHRTNSVFLASLAYAVTYLPALVAGPVSGLLADIRPRREVMVVCDLVRALLVALMCLPGIPIFGLLVILLAVSAVESPFAAARAALVPDLLEGEAYPVGQSLTQVTDQVAQILGFGVGGAVVGLLSARGALAIDAATFLGSAYLLRVLVRSRPAPATRSQASVWIDALEGARVVWSSPLLRNLILVTVVSLGCMIATEGSVVAAPADRDRAAPPRRHRHRAVVANRAAWFLSPVGEPAFRAGAGSRAARPGVCLRQGPHHRYPGRGVASRGPRRPMDESCHRHRGGRPDGSIDLPAAGGPFAQSGTPPGPPNGACGLKSRPRKPT